MILKSFIQTTDSVWLDHDIFLSIPYSLHNIMTYKRMSPTLRGLDPNFSANIETNLTPFYKCKYVSVIYKRKDDPIHVLISVKVPFSSSEAIKSPPKDEYVSSMTCWMLSEPPQYMPVKTNHEQLKQAVF